jgi:hypothetical protein
VRDAQHTSSVDADNTGDRTPKSPKVTIQAHRKNAGFANASTSITYVWRSTRSVHAAK